MSGWSSASTIRIGSAATFPSRWQRRPHIDQRAVDRGRDGKDSARMIDPLRDADEPEMPRFRVGAEVSRNREADSIVGNPERDLGDVAAQFDADVARLRVTQRIADRFLRDAKQRERER